MKQLTPVKFALTFAGCFLGAGYVSGQELWQFFGVFGRGGLLGLALAMAFLFLMAVLLLRLADRTGIDEVDRLVVCWDIPVLRGLMSGLELVFLFGIGTVMTAGVGALLQQLFGLPTWVGGALFAAAVAVIALSGLRGLVSAFSVSVPILVAVTIAFGAVSLAKNGFSALPAATYRGTNPMMPVWWVGAMTFACYNIFGNFAVLAPLSRYIPNKKTAYLGTGLGALLLLCIALGVMLSLYASPSALKAELPMLSLSSGVSPALGYGYGFLLLLAMFGTTLSTQVALIDFICRKSGKIARRRPAAVGVCAACSFAGSLAGFGSLIGTVYPVFGYCSSVFVVLMAVHYVKARRSGETAAKA
jgi:uncharacterized membrane protein YkvI